MARLSSDPGTTVRRHRGSAGGTPLLLPPAAAPSTAVVTGRERSCPLSLERRVNSYTGERELKKPKKPMRKEAANVKWVTHDAG